jgi:hypothetical protein
MLTTASHLASDALAPTRVRWTVASVMDLVTLLLVLILSTNFQIQTLLVEPIRKELQFSDLQLGQLHGPMWALVGLAVGESALLPIVYALAAQAVPQQRLPLTVLALGVPSMAVFEGRYVCLVEYVRGETKVS